MTALVLPTNLSSPKRSTKAFAALLKRFRNDDDEDNHNDEDDDSDLDFGCSGLSYIDYDDSNDTQGFAAAARFMESELHISLEKAHLERNKRNLKQERHERADNTAAAAALYAIQQASHTPLQLQSRSMSISVSA
jgi:hypothetical protein